MQMRHKFDHAVRHVRERPVGRLAADACAFGRRVSWRYCDFSTASGCRLRVGTEMMLRESIALMRQPRGCNPVSARCRATPSATRNVMGFGRWTALPRLPAAPRLARGSANAAGCTDERDTP